LYASGLYKELAGIDAFGGASHVFIALSANAPRWTEGGTGRDADAPADEEAPAPSGGYDERSLATHELRHGLSVACII